MFGTAKAAVAREFAAPHRPVRARDRDDWVWRNGHACEKR